MRNLSQLGRERLRRSIEGAEQREPEDLIDYRALRASRELERTLLIQLEDRRGMPFQRAPRLRVQDIDLG